MEIISLFLTGLETDRLVEYLMGPAKGSDNYVILSRGLVYTIVGVPPCSTVLWACSKERSQFPSSQDLRSSPSRGGQDQERSPGPTLIWLRKDSQSGAACFSWGPVQPCVKGPRAKARLPD